MLFFWGAILGDSFATFYFKVDGFYLLARYLHVEIYCDFLESLLF